MAALGDTGFLLPNGRGSPPTSSASSSSPTNDVTKQPGSRDLPSGRLGAAGPTGAQYTPHSHQFPRTRKMFDKGPDQVRACAVARGLRTAVRGVPRPDLRLLLGSRLGDAGAQSERSPAPCGRGLWASVTRRPGAYPTTKAGTAQATPPAPRQQGSYIPSPHSAPSPDSAPGLRDAAARPAFVWSELL